MVAPSPGLVKLNNKDNKELLGKPEDEPPRPLPADLLDSLSVKVGDDVTEDCLHGLTQRMISTKIDLQNKQLFADQVQDAGCQGDFSLPPICWCLADLCANPRPWTAHARTRICCGRQVPSRPQYI